MTYDGTYVYQGRTTTSCQVQARGDHTAFQRHHAHDHHQRQLGLALAAELAGGGVRINEVLAAHGSTSLRINSRTRGPRGRLRGHGGGADLAARDVRALRAYPRRPGGIGPPRARNWTASSRIYWDGEALSRYAPPCPRRIRKRARRGKIEVEAVLVNAHRRRLCVRGDHEENPEPGPELEDNERRLRAGSATWPACYWGFISSRARGEPRKKALAWDR